MELQRLHKGLQYGQISRNMLIDNKHFTNVTKKNDNENLLKAYNTQLVTKLIIKITFTIFAVMAVVDIGPLGQ